jgi:hypothetical protein
MSRRLGDQPHRYGGAPSLAARNWRHCCASYPDSSTHGIGHDYVACEETGNIRFHYKHDLLTT